MATLREVRAANTAMMEQALHEDDFELGGEFFESLKNLELIKNLLPTLSSKYGYNQRKSEDGAVVRKSALSGGGFAGRGARGLSALGPDSETKKIGSTKIEATHASEQAARGSDDKEEYARVSAIYNKNFDALEKLGKKAIRTKNADGVPAFAVVYRVGGKAVAMLWNQALELLSSTGNLGSSFSVTKEWTFATADGFWDNSKTVKQRNYAAKANWDKWKHVQVATAVGGQSDAISGATYKVANNPGVEGKEVEVWAIYPDIVSFKRTQDRMAARKGATAAMNPGNAGREMQKGLIASALDRKYGEKINQAKKILQDNFTSVGKEVADALESGYDRKKWQQLQSRVAGLQNTMEKLNSVISRVESRKSHLGRKAVGGYTYDDKFSSEEALNDAMKDLLGWRA